MRQANAPAFFLSIDAGMPRYVHESLTKAFAIRTKPLESLGEAFSSHESLTKATLSLSCVSCFFRKMCVEQTGITTDQLLHGLARIAGGKQTRFIVSKMLLGHSRRIMRNYVFVYLFCVFFLSVIIGVKTEKNRHRRYCT